MPAGTRPPDSKEGVAMNDTMIPDSRGSYSPWLEMMSNVVWGQWRRRGAEHQATLALLKTLARPQESEAGPAAPGTAALPPRGACRAAGRARGRRGRGG